LEPGSVFGVRPATSAKKWRLVTEITGVNKVWTFDDKSIAHLIKQSKHYKR